MTSRSAITLPMLIQARASASAASTTRISVRVRSLDKRESASGRSAGRFLDRSIFGYGATSSVARISFKTLQAAILRVQVVLGTLDNVLSCGAGGKDQKIPEVGFYTSYS